MFEPKTQKTLLQIVYRSEVVGDFSLQDYDVFFQRWQEKNRRLRVTGMLLACNGMFSGVLEGSPHVLMPLLEAIAGDRRHCGMKVLTEMEVTERRFSSWYYNAMKSPSDHSDPTLAFVKTLSGRL